MDKMQNKKGVVFTIVAIVLAAFFTLIFSAKFEKPLDYKTEILEARISILSDYMNTFFDYTEGTASIAGYSALRGIIMNISEAGEYNPNFETQFSYCVKTGNLTSANICSNMTNQTLTYFLNQLSSMGVNELNINSTYALNSISINQTTEDAFSVEVTVNITVNITDNYANISETRAIKSNISINGLLDPFYLLNGTYNHTIISYEKPEENWTYTDLQKLYYTNAYRWYRGKGISFLDRIKGNLVPSYYGIGSFVNYTFVDYTTSHSLIDFLFWQNITFNCLPTVSTEVIGINDTASFPLKSGVQYFQLDATNAAGFFIPSGLVISACP